MEFCIHVFCKVVILDQSHFYLLEHVAVSGDIYMVSSQGDQWIEGWTEARDSAKPPTMPRTVPYNKDLPGSKYK